MESPFAVSVFFTSSCAAAVLAWGLINTKADESSPPAVKATPQVTARAPDDSVQTARRAKAAIADGGRGLPGKGADVMPRQRGAQGGRALRLPASSAIAVGRLDAAMRKSPNAREQRNAVIRLDRDPNTHRNARIH